MRKWLHVTNFYQISHQGPPSLVSLSLRLRPSTTSIMRKAVSVAARPARHARSLQNHSASTVPPVKITTLPNKIRVATEAVPGHFAGVGLYVDAGSRYETPENSGVSHFLDRLAFKVSLERYLVVAFVLFACRVHTLVLIWTCLPQFMLSAAKFNAPPPVRQ